MDTEEVIEMIQDEGLIGAILNIDNLSKIEDIDLRDKMKEIEYAIIELKDLLECSIISIIASKTC